MGVNSSLVLGHFDIYQFEFAEYLRKYITKITKNQPTFEIFKKHIEDTLFF